jgi:hypothetical protein
VAARAPRGTSPAKAPAVPARPRSGRTVFGWVLPLTDLHMRRISLLEELVGRGAYLGWGQEKGSRLFFVDVRDVDGEGITRSTGETLHLAITAAIDATGGVFRE